MIGSVIAADERRTRRGKLFQAILSDNTGNVTLTWFRGIHYIKQSVKKGDRLAVHGKVDVFNGFQIVHPEYDKLDTDTDPLSTGGIIPLYPLAKDLKKVGLDHRRLRRIIREIQTGLERIPDFLPQEILQEFHLISLNQALQWIHFAEESNALKQAIHRLKFDEHFFLQLLMAVRHSAATQTQTRALDATGPYVKAIYDTLNFELTDAQKRVLKEIRSDLARGTTMNCLLQGDVGSGKPWWHCWRLPLPSATVPRWWSWRPRKSWRINIIRYSVTMRRNPKSLVLSWWEICRRRSVNER